MRAARDPHATARLSPADLSVEEVTSLQLILTADHDVRRLFQLVVVQPGAGHGSTECAQAALEELVGAELATGHQLGELRSQTELHVQETVLPRIRTGRDVRADAAHIGRGERVRRR